MRMNMIYKYAVARGVTDRNYLEYVRNPSSYRFVFKIAMAEDLAFEVNRLFDDSLLQGYGLMATNEILGTNEGDILSIGSIEGDDIVCMNIPSKAIYLWMIENGDGEYIKIADSFEDFLDKCCE